jgi:hypothetical protein
MGSGFVKVAARRKIKVKHTKKSKKTRVEIKPSRRRVIAFPCKNHLSQQI